MDCEIYKNIQLMNNSSQCTIGHQTLEPSEICCSCSGTVQKLSCGKNQPNALEGDIEVLRERYSRVYQSVQVQPRGKEFFSESLKITLNASATSTAEY